MTLRDLEDSSDDKRDGNKGPCQFFVRIENLPWTASHSDVRAFFRGLDISPGGISIVGRNAFVSFERWGDMASALLREGRAVLGHKLLLSVVDLKLMQKINARQIQRSLYFLSVIGTAQSAVPEPSDRRRKIRPTALVSDRTESNVAFTPDEIESSKEGFDADRVLPTMTSVLGRKRIKPTMVRKTCDPDSSAFTQSSFQSFGNFETLICL